MAFTSQLGSRTGMLGVVFLIIGGILIYILKTHSRTQMKLK